MSKILRRFEQKFVKQVSGCWEWSAFISPNRYGMFRYEGRTQCAHRVSWMLYKGSIPEDMYILHKCNNKACVNPSHLYIGTQHDNMMDCVRAGNHYASAILKVCDVVCIKRMLRDNISKNLIAWIYQVKMHVIYAISRGHTWNSVTIE